MNSNIFIAHDIFESKFNLDCYYSVYDYFNGGNLS